MKTRTLVLLAFAEALCVLAAVYFEPTCCVRGRLHGEAFFDGKSTSWWRRELDHWEVDARPLRGRGVRMYAQPRLYYHYTRTPSRFEETSNRWLEVLNTDEKVVEGRLILLLRSMDGDGPKLLNGDAQALPVLFALLDDPSPRIRRFARIGLKMDPEGP
jgi:hypothetical protein